MQGIDFCNVSSACHEPHYGNFGSVECGFLKAGETVVDLKKVDRGLTLTTSVGFFQKYVTILCK